MGTGLWLRFYGLPDGGRANVSIDGGTAKTLETYCDSDRMLIGFVASNLSPAKHTVKVEVAGTKDVLSKGYKVAVDAFIVELSRGAMQMWAMVENIIEGTVDIASVYGRGSTIDAVLRPSSGTGKLIFWDDFEDTLLKWGYPDGVVVARDTTTAFRGGASLKIGTSDEKNIAWARRIFSIVPSQKIGVEVKFYVPDWERLAYFYITLDYRDGVYQRIASIRYDVGNQIWQYYGADANYHDIEGSAQTVQYASFSWIGVKFVADFSSEKYVSLTANQQTFNLSDYGIRKLLIEAQQEIALEIGIESESTAYIRSYYVDDVVVTEEE
jgi:hypothetical protein